MTLIVLVPDLVDSRPRVLRATYCADHHVCEIVRYTNKYGVEMIWKGQRKMWEVRRVPSPHEGYGRRYTWLSYLIFDMTRTNRYARKTRHDITKFATETILTHSFFHG